MMKAAEFRQHAAECRALARSIHNEDHRQQLLHMAEIWESLASERERMLRARGDREKDE